MKVHLRKSYKYNDVVLEPTDVSYGDKEFVIELDRKDVLDILRIQTEFEEIQQRLSPLFEAADERQRARREAEKLAKEAEEADAARFEATKVDEEVSIGNS